MSLQLGPVVLPAPVLLVLASTLLAFWLARRLARPLGVDTEPRLWGVLLAALLCARLAFVWNYREAYLAAPLSALDIRDGGWSPVAGIVGGWLATAVLLPVRRPERRPVLRALAAATGLWLAGTLALQWHGLQQQRSLPALLLVAVDGRTVDLRSFRGKPVVLNLWATWCPPCRREMPVLQQLQAERADVHVVFANQGESAARVLQYLAGQQLQLHHLLFDPKASAGQAFGHRALPTTYFFDREGRLVDARIGELSRATLAERLHRIAP
ncbi:TlpA disulfide reductase family protein [Pseudorhodoferax soli]|uniref:Thiol-disulfide isomerase/thioredoxin n=1 Tax=Pseudorhodoferax soli TaxID=545864 RepID=A0A368XWW2_9BURK|nr:TlpA disulfide reductase family protein [Pseudorhodoferax soli]RCW72463.1 thiol-disulfide isomerase/thioredoxin [Pseudorhodoferax soli]